jgi:EamA-like transporter family
MKSSTLSGKIANRGFWIFFILLAMSSSIHGFMPRHPLMNHLERPVITHPYSEALSPTTATNMKSLDSTKILDAKSATDGEKKSSLLWKGVVLAICVVWSTNFAVIKEIFQAAPTIDPSLYAAIRFSLASLVMLPRTFNSIKNVELIGSSMAVGLSVFFGYFGQSIGLMTTTANKSSFICSLNVVWVALIAGLIKKDFKVQSLISAFLAVVGVAVLELDGNSPPVIGDLWSICQPVGFGTGYLLLEGVVAKFPDNPGTSCV